MCWICCETIVGSTASIICLHGEMVKYLSGWQFCRNWRPRLCATHLENQHRQWHRYWAVRWIDTAWQLYHVIDTNAQIIEIVLGWLEWRIARVEPEKRPSRKIRAYLPFEEVRTGTFIENSNSIDFFLSFTEKSKSSPRASFELSCMRKIIAYTCNASTIHWYMRLKPHRPL